MGKCEASPSRRVRKIAVKRLLASSFLSVRMEQLGYHWTDFCKVRYLSIFRKAFEKIHFTLKSNNNDGYFTWRRMDSCDDLIL